MTDGPTEPVSAPSPEPAPSSPSRRGQHASRQPRRWLPLVVVVAAVAGAGAYDHWSPRPSGEAGAAAASAAVSVAAVPPAGAESSSWYCTGGTGSMSTLATPTVYLTNTSTRPVTGTATIISDNGTSVTEPVSVPAATQVELAPASLVQGWWVASRIELEGGGVVATQAVRGPAGWSVAPCANSTSPTWFFASGNTAGGSDLFVTMFNPTVTMAVVDLRMTDSSGSVSPPPFQQMVVPAGGLVVVNAGDYVQNDPSFATSVVTLSGRVVTDALEQVVGPRPGLSLSLGAESPSTVWSLPRTVAVTGGADTLDVYNPTSSTERVRASFALATGAPAPIDQLLAPGARSTLVLSDTSRLPHNDDFAVTVRSSGGGGVVVGRVVEAPTGGQAPRWGAAPAVDQSLWSGGTRSWILPAPGLPGQPAVAGAAPFALAVANQGTRTATVHLGVLSSSGIRPLGAPVQIGPGAFTVVESPVMGQAGLLPVVVTADGPVALSEDLVPAGAPGVVTLPGLPMG